MTEASTTTRDDSRTVNRTPAKYRPDDLGTRKVSQRSQEHNSYRSMYATPFVTRYLDLEPGDHVGFVLNADNTASLYPTDRPEDEYKSSHVVVDGNHSSPWIPPAVLRHIGCEGGDRVRFEYGDNGDVILRRVD